MDSLIPIDYSSDRPTVSARELHEYLKLDTDFRHWFPRMCEYGFSANADFARVVQKCPTPGGMQDVVDYQLTISMAKEICMIQRNERGRQARQYFIAIESQWNSPEAVMARALKMADARVHVLEAQTERDKPKVLFADSVAASETSILIGELAKILRQNGIDIGQNRLFAWLRVNGYLIRRQGSDYNMPTQESMDRGLFEIKETTITHASGTVTVSKTPKVTGKGQQYFVNKFLAEEASSC